MAKAQGLLTQAEIVFRAGVPDAAGRAAYFAGFHAAQGSIFERTGKICKTHSGVQTEFARLAKDEPRIDAEGRAFLGRTFNLKTIADYDTSPDSNVTEAQAAAAMAAAGLFVAQLATLLGDGGG